MIFIAGLSLESQNKLNYIKTFKAWCLLYTKSQFPPTHFTHYVLFGSQNKERLFFLSLHPLLSSGIGFIIIDQPPPPSSARQLIIYVTYILLSLRHVHFNLCVMKGSLSARIWTADQAMPLCSWQNGSLATWHTMGLTASEFQVFEAHFLSRTSHFRRITSVLCVDNIVI